MRIAEGGEHTAEVGGDVLHDKGERHVLLLTCGCQNEEAERQKGEERHVVRNQHRADKGNVHKREHAHPRVFEKLHTLAREQIKETDVFERTHHSKHAKKTS